MPPQHIVDHALQIAALSPCRRSKRGVVIWDEPTGVYRGHGFNAPPSLLACPGREICAGTCGQRAVHAEVRAVYSAALARIPNLETSGVLSELLHVELAPVAAGKPGAAVSVGGRATWGGSGGAARSVVACDGPRCGPCAALIADVGWIGGVWLFEQSERGWAAWRRYSVDDFYEATMHRLERPPATSVPNVGRHVHE